MTSRFMLRISFNKPLPLNAMMISRKRSYGGGDDGRDLEDAGFIFAGDLKGPKGPTAAHGGTREPGARPTLRTPFRAIARSRKSQIATDAAGLKSTFAPMRRLDAASFKSGTTYRAR
jgi:hypothetical protein